MSLHSRFHKNLKSAEDTLAPCNKAITAFFIRPFRKKFVSSISINPIAELQSNSLNYEQACFDDFAIHEIVSQGLYKAPRTDRHPWINK